MSGSLIKYIEKLIKEFKRCDKIDNELHKERSDNYYYHTRKELLREIINDLSDIIIDKDINFKTTKSVFNLIKEND